MITTSKCAKKQLAHILSAHASTAENEESLYKNQISRHLASEEITSKSTHSDKQTKQKQNKAIMSGWGEQEPSDELSYSVNNARLRAEMLSSLMYDIQRDLFKIREDDKNTIAQLRLELEAKTAELAAKSDKIDALKKELHYFYKKWYNLKNFFLVNNPTVQVQDEEQEEAMQCKEPKEEPKELEPEESW